MEDSFGITSRQFGVQTCLQNAFQCLIHCLFLEIVMLTLHTALVRRVELPGVPKDTCVSLLFLVPYPWHSDASTYDPLLRSERLEERGATKAATQRSCTAGYQENSRARVPVVVSNFVTIAAAA
jgi:hypothetical protein